MNRLSIKIGGASGQGINSIGEILGETIKNTGYYVFGYREYPSLIRGGYACYQIDFSDELMNSSSKYCNILILLNEVSFDKHLYDVREKGIIVHSINSLTMEPEQKEFISQNNIKLVYINAEEIAKGLGGSSIMSNIILTGLVWKIFDFDISFLESEIKERFMNKPELLEIDLKCMYAGYEYNAVDSGNIEVNIKSNPEHKKTIQISGNHALSIGSIAAGMRAFYSYPMTPASSILTYLAEVQKETGIIVKQAEDEISAAQMAIGSMYAGTRALVATSGGGFDLMTESLSLAGMTETPFVCVIAQRPGPATGVPTWTAASDLNLAVYSGHGEFPRIVIAASDSKSAFNLIQEAFNLADKFQVPVLLLTEKQIAESIYNLDKFDDIKVIDRGFSEGQERYEFTKSGVSKRWLPGYSDSVFTANCDEHNELGESTEDPLTIKKMIEKRMSKLASIFKGIPEPQLFGEEESDILIVGWGSTRNSVIDAIDILSENKYPKRISYLHFDYIYPLKTTRLMNLIGKAKSVLLVENNYIGQLGELIKKECGYEFRDKLLKYDGRPFFIEDIIDYIDKHYE